MHDRNSNLHRPDQGNVSPYAQVTASETIATAKQHELYDDSAFMSQEDSKSGKVDVMISAAISAI